MDFMKLDNYLRGPPAGDIVKGLAEIRLAVLHHGIPSNSDGIVTHCPASQFSFDPNIDKLDSPTFASTFG